MNLRVLVAAAAAALVLAAPVLAARPSTTQHDRDVIRFFSRHPGLAHTAAGERALWRVLGDVVDQLRAVQSARAVPPHMALWQCIHGGEGAWDDPNSGNNGHWGGLQMHPDWGYGTSYYASDDSELVQVWAAERGYKASNYSRDWLYQQWGADSRCFYLA